MKVKFTEKNEKCGKKKENLRGANFKRGCLCNELLKKVWSMALWNIKEFVRGSIFGFCGCLNEFFLLLLGLMHDYVKHIF